ncbi:hypothetical protein [Nocardia sp. NPDC004711]
MKETPNGCHEEPERDLVSEHLDRLVALSPPVSGTARAKSSALPGTTGLLREVA